MSVPYDTFASAFLFKISEYDFLSMGQYEREVIIDGYMKRSISKFKNVCKYDLVTTANDNSRTFNVVISDEDIDEIVDIVSEGMVVQWLKQYVFQQDLLQNILNTRDFSTYSPAELLLRVKDTYSKTQKDHTNMIREYSYNHGEIGSFHI